MHRPRHSAALRVSVGRLGELGVEIKAALDRQTVVGLGGLDDITDIVPLEHRPCVPTEVGSASHWPVTWRTHPYEQCHRRNRRCRETEAEPVKVLLLVILRRGELLCELRADSVGEAVGGVDVVAHELFRR